MRVKTVFLILSCLLAISLLLSSCGSTSTSTSTTTTTTSGNTTTTSNVTTSPSSTTKTSTTSTTGSTTGKWWDKLGKPTYGGTLTLFSATNITGFDDWNNPGQTCIMNAWEDALVADDWTLDPKIFAYQLAFRPSDYEVGCLGTSWEFTDPLTYVVHLRQGVHWQNVAPSTGRELVADDIVFHFDRRMGWGHGYTTPSPYYAAATIWQSMKSVTALDKYTVAFKFAGVSEESITETLQGGGSDEYFESPETIKAYTNAANPQLTDWHQCIGSGPFIWKDYVSSASATLVKNPDYFGHDERYPQNQLPYIDELKVLIIPDAATSLAALRTGKIDVMDNINLANAQQVKKTNPEILSITYPGGTPSIDPKNDVKPFTDIKVRQAMQMALDLPTIAATYYSGSCPATPSTMTSMYMTGWTYPYDQWPQDLKDSYAYNPTKAKQLLSDAGFPTGFKTDIVAANNNDLDLLQIVKSYYAAVGIDMTINTYDFATWNTMVRAKKHDQLAYNNSIGFSFPPLMGFRRWQSTSGNNWCDVNDASWDALYLKALAATNVTDTKALVVQGNTNMAAQHWEITLCTPNMFALYQPWLKGYNGQAFSVSALGGGTGALWMGFYSARFWIDTSLKKSLGH